MADARKRSRRSLLGDRRGAGNYVQGLILIAALGLAGVAAVMALSSAVGTRSDCAGEQIRSFSARAGCAEGDSEGQPTANEPPEAPPAPEANDEEKEILDELLALAADLIGLTDAKKCITEGDLLACFMTALNFTPGKIFGLGFKLIAKSKKIFNLIDRLLNARKAKKADDAVAGGAQCKNGKCDEPGVCFAPGTPVRTEDGLVPIEKLRPGDRVWSRDEQTGEEGYRRVVRTFVTPDRPILALSFADATRAGETLEVTPEHPFWVEGRGWVVAGDLLPDDELVGADGARLRVSDSRATASTMTVYNLEVEEFHTYFVGESGAWVHNQCKKDEKKPKKEKGNKKTNEKCKSSDECAVGHCHKKDNGDQVCVQCSERDMAKFKSAHAKFCGESPRSCTTLDVVDEAPDVFRTRAENGRRCSDARRGEHFGCFGGVDAPGFDHPGEIRNVEIGRSLCACLGDVASNASLNDVDKRTHARACRAKFHF